MQHYNYADEIIKDYDYQPGYHSTYTRDYYMLPDDDIVNAEEQDIPVNSTDSEEDEYKKYKPEEKRNAFEEGIKNDSINIEGNDEKGGDKEDVDVA